MLAPIALFTYNRTDHLHRTIESLKKNYLASESDLFLFSDGWKDDEDRIKVENVRKYLQSISGFKTVTIFERSSNYGIARSEIEGITQVLSQNERIIVMEDDLITSPYTLRFLNDALEIYKNDLNTATIHSHIENIKGLPELFFDNKSGCLAWATWARAWREISFDEELFLKEIESQNRTHEFDRNGTYPFTQLLRDHTERNDRSWDYSVYACFFLKNMLTLYPGESFVQHIGFDSGTHFNKSNKLSDLDGKITKREIRAKRIPVEINYDALKKIESFYRNYFRKKNKLTLIKILKKINRRIRKYTK
jgi:GT2 family glycosyltransferase